MVMQLDIQLDHDKTSLGIAYGVTRVKVTVAKNRKMVSVKLLEFGMGYGHEN